MSRIPAIDPAAAQGRAQQLLEAVQQKMGKAPNMTRVLANAPAALDAYLAFSGALAKGALDAKVRERIALLVAEANQCDYCLSAHTAIGGMVGLSADEVRGARAAQADDPKVQALLTVARALVVNRGRLADAELQRARDAGVDDGELLEVVANVTLNILTNYTNHVADPEIDFPKVSAAAVAV